MNPATKDDFGSSIYDADGKFLGEFVLNLTDGPTDRLEGEPYGTLGQICPSQGVDEFYRNIWNNKPYYSLRTAYDLEFGRVNQALVRSFDDTLQWINLPSMIF